MDKIRNLISDTRFISLVIGILVTGSFLLLKEGFLTSAIYSLIIWLTYELVVVLKLMESDNIMEIIDGIKGIKIKDLYYLGGGILYTIIIYVIQYN